MLTVPSVSDAVALIVTVAGAVNVALFAGEVMLAVGDALAPETLTLLMAAVVNVPLACDVTANPTYTELVMVMVAVPIVVQDTPSADLDAVNVFPVRFTFTQTGMLIPAAAVLALVPPVVVRLWNETPLLGVATTIACVEFAFKVSRIITPAFAQPFVLVKLFTFAMISVLPLTD